MKSLVYSQLENGHLVDAKLLIDSMFPTQWGLRRVVKHVVIPVGSPDHITIAEHDLNVQ